MFPTKTRRGKLCCKILIILLTIRIIHCDFCNNKYIAPSLFYRLLPKTIHNPQDKDIQPVPNSTCVFKRQDDKLILRSTDESTGFPGYNCISLPQNTSKFGFGTSSSNIKHLVVQNTNIETFQKNVFSTWYGVEILEISMNQKLKIIVPGAFMNLINVWNLSISDNPCLGTLDPETFKGLSNLRGLRYLRNNITKLANITVTLRPAILPLLTVLDLSGNNISRIEKDDFLPMNNSNLYKLLICLTKTKWIHKEAFDPLGPFVEIVLARNILNTSVVVDLLNHMKGKNSSLISLVLGENALSVNPRPVLEAVSDHISFVDLQSNHFGVLSQGMFPKMPHLHYLDLTNVMIDDLGEGVLDSKFLPKLKHLYLGRNIFSGLKSSMVLQTLQRLDISFNENDLPWSTIFQIDPTVFIKAPHLQLLNLSGNQIKILRRHTLNNTNSLRILLLQNAFINEIEDGTFDSCEQLFYLDLSSNMFPMVNPFTKEIFRGLSELLALDLSNCGISSINKDQFFYVKKLQYLTLRSNSIYHLSPDIFYHMPQLVILDLRYNIIETWKNRLFESNTCMKIIHLDYNHIQSISKNMLQDFLMSKTVKLSGNSIICDCNLVNIVAAVLNSNMIIDKLPFRGDENSCVNRDQSFQQFLKSVNFAQCVNTGWITIVIVTVIFIIIVVIILYIIYYYYKYDIHFWFLRTKRRLGLLHYIGTKKTGISDDFKYDAFVSYCVEDEKFVEKMVYILETDCSRFNLCVFERDFKVGDVLTDKILKSMESSRRTILVLTESFAKSHWCCWEMYIAESRSISLSNSDPNDPLILIKKSDIPESLMTTTLKYLMKTRVYLEWPDSPAKQKIFWEQLKNSLKTKRIVLEN